MRNFRQCLAALVAVLIQSNLTLAAPVTIEGVHLCCGACAKAVNEALADVEGVTNVAVDKDTGKVTFDAADKKGARAGVRALARAGFAGAAKFEGQEVAFPKGVDAEGQADSVTIKGVHNCCPMCVTAITDALKGVSGVTAVKCEKKTCTVTGTGVSYTALIKALHDSGLHGSIEVATPATDPAPDPKPNPAPQP